MASRIRLGRALLRHLHRRARRAGPALSGSMLPPTRRSRRPGGRRIGGAVQPESVMDIGIQGLPVIAWTVVLWSRHCGLHSPLRRSGAFAIDPRSSCVRPKRRRAFTSAPRALDETHRGYSREKGADPGAHLSMMIDPFGRSISYVRVSVTDRCDFRCVLHGRGHDLPAEEGPPHAGGAGPAVLGVRRPRRVQDQAHRRRASGPAQHHEPGPQPGPAPALGRAAEANITTNGSQLDRFASELYEYGVRRVNVSLDTLDPARFQAITGGVNTTR